MTKKQIRSKILLRLKTQKEEDRERKSRAILKKLFGTLIFKKAKTVMFYISFDGEVDTREMIKKARGLGKIIAVPVSAKKGMIYPALLNENARLLKGPYGVREPAVQRTIDLHEIDLVVVPGVAFDKHGRRLGRGKGCYDRLLSKFAQRAFTLGLAFDFQILPSLPTTAHDVSVKEVLSN